MICVDASVATKWIFDEEHSPQAWSLLRRSLENGETLVAPPLLPSEVTNAIRQQIRRGFAGAGDGPGLLADFLSVPVALRTPDSLYQRALALATELGLPATYDAQYVVLSELLGATFWTADVRLFRATAPQMPFVRWIGDYAG